MLLETIRHCRDSEPTTYQNVRFVHCLLPACMTTPKFEGAGTMRQLCREMDWARTRLGPASAWTGSLVTTTELVLGCSFPMIVLWGPDLIQIYNDAYIPFLGAKHPWGLGIPTQECWPEAWAFNAPVYERVFAGDTVSFEDQLYQLFRRGPDEPADDVYITLSFSPVRAETGYVAGVLVTLIDTTSRVDAGRLADERTAMLRDLEVERARLGEVFRQSPSFLAVLHGPQHVVGLANEAYRSLLGNRDLVGRPVFDAVPEAASQGFREMLTEVLETGKTRIGSAVQATIMSASGDPEQVYVDYVFQPLVESDGTRSGVIVHGSVVTEHVRAQQEASRLLGESERSRQELEAANVQLREQAIELELANERLQETAAELEATTSELEASAEELENTLAALEERTEAAETAERTLSNVFAQAPAAVSVTSGPDHRFVLINARAVEIIGRTNLVGQSFADAFPDLADQGFARILDEVYTSGERHVANEAPVIITRPDGSADQRWFDFVYEPLRDASGAVTGVLQHSVEVTQRVIAQRAVAESERQFRTLADAIPTLAWTAGREGYIDWYNARWYEYTGTTPAQMEGWGWQSVHDPDVLPTVMERWQASIASGEQFEMTFPLRAADGSYRSFLTRVSPVKDEDGHVLRWFGTNTDVTLEEAARREAQEANAAKSQFLANMSHELRQPLNAITGYADLITMGVRGPVTQQQLEDLERIRFSSTHLTSLISDILQFAKLEAGQLEYHLSDVLVGETLRESATFVAPQVREKKLVFTLESIGEDVRVHADRDRFVQVVLNLLTNATKFTGEGGSITVSARCNYTDDTVAITVTDTGIGIAPDKLQRIFDPFVQVHRSLNRPSDGTGLGLAIARDIARNMNGDLTVQSDEGVGSAFVLTLPAGGVSSSAN